jgi:hypothetical protein
MESLRMMLRLVENMEAAQHFMIWADHRFDFALQLLE